MSSVHWLHEAEIPRSRGGGKAASLSTLAVAGLPVPPGFCIDAEAYRAFSRSLGLDADAPASEVAAALARAPLPQPLVSEIAEAFGRLAQGTGASCAVRSSAVAEDGAESAFAGLYETYLNLRSLDEVLEAVRACYASLWSERAVAYRERRGIDPAGEAMAVVVMTLVPAEVAGVAFTAHPVTGERDRIVIDAAWGLGEAVVSGSVTPDSYVVARDGFAILEREVAAKRSAVYPRADAARTEQRDLEPARASAPCLGDDDVARVARLATAVEQHYGAPQDVEWALSGGELFLLQSRPITALA